MTIIHVDEVEKIDRGGSIVTIPLITKHSDSTAAITTGISTYPRGMGAPLHLHNCDEHVTLLEGQADVIIEGVVTPLEQYDTTYIPAGQQHAFRNRSDGPMRILWVYPTQQVTRTLIATGKTVEHLSDEDMMAQ
jgi:mannose-6-phosphate isomerase-like protein (cupin superfamily)